MTHRHTPPAFLPHFCPSLQKDIVFVRQADGSYLKYRFSMDSREFQRIQCTDCLLEVTEQDLRPLYTAWSRKLGRYVIFVRNVLNGSVEQYVYEKRAARFYQIDLPPDIRFEAHRRQASATLFTVGGVGESAVTLVSRDTRGFLRRKRYNEEVQRFEDLPSTPVIPLDTKSSLRIPLRTRCDENKKEASDSVGRRQIEEKPADSSNLQRWLSQCLSMKPKSRRTAERERDMQLESLLRSRENEYKRNYLNHHNSEPLYENETIETNHYENEEIYAEFTRNADYLTKEDDSSEALCNFWTPQNSPFHSTEVHKGNKRKLHPRDVDCIRKITRQLENSPSSDEDKILIEEEVYEVVGSEMTV